MNKRIRNINENFLKDFGNNLRAERNRRGLSQEGLGELANIDGRYISKIENGDVNPTLTTITALLKALDLPFEVLCDYKK